MKEDGAGPACRVPPIGGNGEGVGAGRGGEATQAVRAAFADDLVETG
jgi:hypothetical protein